MSQPAAYSRVQILLHWLIALLIAGAYFTSDQMHVRPGETMEGVLIAGLPLHAVLGIAVLALVVIRLLVRATKGAPGAAHGTPPLVELAGVWGHRVLYLLMLLVPVGGMLAFFGGIRTAGDVHGLIGNALVLLALAHAAVALFHQYVLRDGTLTRMTRPGS